MTISRARNPEVSVLRLKGGLKIRIITYANVRQALDFSTIPGDTISALDVRVAGVATA